MKSNKKLCLILISLLLLLSFMLVACNTSETAIRVTFSVDGEVHREFIIANGAGIEDIPDVPQKDGYIGQWNKTDFSEFYKDTTISAVYTKNYFTVTFRVNNLIIRTTNIEYGKNPASLPTVPPKTGFTGAWAVTDFTEMRIDTDINAVYTPIELTITFVSKGNNDIIRKVNYGDSLLDIPQVPEKEGNVGVWETTNFENLTKNITVEAKYELKILNITLIGADDETIVTTAVAFEDTLSLPVTQTREGYIFNGWYFDEEYENEATNQAVYEDMNIYAYWIKINHDSATSLELFDFVPLDDGTFEITPSLGSEMPFDVVLPNSFEGKLVTKIANDAFANNININTILLPVGITEIGNNAFRNCSNITNISFAPRNRLEKIGNYAFYQNPSLEKIDIARTIKTIGNFAFAQCMALINVNIPIEGALKEIGNNAFEGSPSIQQLNISRNIVTIGDYAFSYLTNTNINFEGLIAIDSVGRFAFQNCSRVYEFNAPNITSIGEGALKGCGSLMSLTITGEIPILDFFGEDTFSESYLAEQIIKKRDEQGEFIKNDDAFVYHIVHRRVPLSLTTITIRNGENHIADYLLNNIVSVTNIHIPASVKTIGKYAFAVQNTESQTTMQEGVIDIPETSRLEIIDEGAFFRRSSFSTINLPSQLKRIEDSAFGIALSLATINLANEECLEFVGRDAFVNTEWMGKKGSGVMYFGGFALGYKDISNVGDINLNFTSTTKAIVPYAFKGRQNIVSIEIPATLKTIHEFAFSECGGLVSIKMAEGIDEIEDSAFNSCENLKNVFIPKSVNKIGKNIFANCNNITTMNVYGDRLLGEYFSQSNELGTYSAEQQQQQNIESIVIQDDENENSYFIRWTQFKDIYDNFPAFYSVEINGAINNNGEPRASFRLGTISHNYYDSQFYEKDSNGVYHFEMVISYNDTENGRTYSSLIGNNFILDKNVKLEDVLSVKALFIETYYIPLSIKKVVLIDDIDATNREIKDYAFSNMTSLEELVLPNGIVAIGEYAFQNCTNLGRKIVGEGFENIDLNLPSSLEIIKNNAFEGTTHLKGITYSPSPNLTEIEKGAFSFSGLTSFYVTNSLRIIGNNAFESSVHLNSLLFENLALDKDMDGEVLNSLTIKNDAFKGCSSLTSIIFPDRLTSLGNNSFESNTSLSSVVFTETSELKELGDKAFSSCSSLISIVLPQKTNLDGVDSLLFGCGGLRDITIYNTNAENYHSVTLGMLFGMEIYDRSYEAIQNGERYYLPLSLTTINLLGGKVSARMLENANVTRIVNLEEITSIGESAFKNCTNIEKIELPDTVLSVNDYAFYGCNSIMSFTITNESMLEDIGSYAFAECSALENFVFPIGITTIHSYSFYNCFALENIGIENIQEIEEYAFYGCLAISLLELSPQLTSIGNYAFYDCKQAEIPFAKLDNLEFVGNFAFYNCLGIRALHAENIQEIGIKAFAGAYNLEELSLAGNIGLGSVFGSAFFENSYAINQNGNYYIPYSLLRVIISSQAISIPNNAFKDCTSIEYIIFHSVQPPTLGNEVFQNTSNSLKYFVPVESKDIYTQMYDLFADDIYSHPSSYENFEFSLNGDGTYSISQIAESTLGEVLYIPSYYNEREVTIIAPNGFKNNTSIKEVIIPDSIKKIGVSAFENCTAIERITFEGGSKLEKIDNNAFNECTSLKKIKIPASVTYIGDYAFAGKRTFVKATNIYVYESDLSLVEFEGNSQLQTIGSYAFYLTKSLTGIIIPGSISTINKAAFSGSGIKTIVFEENGLISNISEEVFMDCTNLVNIILPEYIELIGKNAFTDCIMLEEISFGAGLVEIGERAFYNCLSLKSLSLPNGTNVLGNEAFRYNTELQSVDLPTTIDTIGDYCFSGCISLYDITMNINDIAYIGELAFADTPWYNSQIEQNEDGVVYLNNFVDSYKGEMPIDTTIVLRDGTIGISPRAFENQENLKEILLPSTINIIGGYAFMNCASLSAVTIEDESVLNSIGKYAFVGTNLTAIGLPQSLQSVGDYAFANLSSLVSLELEEGSNLMSIGSGAFMGLINLQVEMVLPLSLQTLATKAFYGSTQMDITIPEGSNLVSIGEQAFSYTKELFVSFPIGIKTINKAFSFTTIDLVQIPEWITKIEPHAFKDSNINHIETVLNNQLITIGDYAFYNLTTAIMTLNDLAKLKSIGSYAFYGCAKLEVVNAESISYIGLNAFENCNNINEMTLNGEAIIDIFGGTVPSTLSVINIAAGTVSIVEGAYKGVSNLVTVNFPSTLKNILQNAFMDSATLATINFEIAESLKYVGKNAFTNTVWLNNKPDGVVYTGKLAYSYKSSDTQTISIKVGATFVAESCFEFSNITDITIPTSVKTIDKNAFNGCTSLERVVGLESLVSIGDNAFDGCENLSSINLPIGIATIGRYAFASCSSLSTINLRTANLGEGVLNGCSGLTSLQTRGNIALHTLFGENDYSDSYTAINNNATYYIPNSLTNITLTSTTIIANNCLQGFVMVNTLRIPTATTKIGNYAFYEMSLLNEIILHGSVTEIGDYAFYNNKKSHIEIADNNIRLVGEFAFVNCFEMSQFNAKNIEIIGKNAFAGCHKLSNITVPNDKSIGEYFGEELFERSYQAYQLKTYYLPTDLEEITVYGTGMLAEYMFGNMLHLNKVTLIGELGIPSTAFEGCESLVTFAGEEIVFIEEGALTQVPWSTNYIANAPNNSLIYVGRVAYFIGV